MKLNAVRIGYGKISEVHEYCMPEGVKTLAIIDTDICKLKIARKDGYKAYKSIDELLKEYDISDIFFWDICSDTKTHADYIHKILSIDSEANILVEKPVCDYDQTEDVLDLYRQNKKAKITVNENYISSAVSREIKNTIDRYQLDIGKIYVESTKNRIRDIERGRFIDNKLCAFGYEGPHMISCVNSLGKGKKFKEIISARTEPLQLPTGKKLDEQDIAEMKYITRDETIVDFYTSMDGHIGTILPILSEDSQLRITGKIAIGDEERYRVLSADDENKKIQIIGRYEPLIGISRSIGQIGIYSLKDEDIIQKELYYIPNDVMKNHLVACINYFKGKIDNPSNIEYAVEIIKILEKAVQISRE